MAWKFPFAKLFSKRLGGPDRDGFMPYHVLGTGPEFNDYSRDVDKLVAIFNNPALLKVFSLQCDLFSLAKPYVYNKKGVLMEDDFALDRLAKPNYLQANTDWLWSYMFWKMVGNAMLYMSSTEVSRDNAPMYWMEPHKIEWPAELEQKKDHLILSKSTWEQMKRTPLIYRYDDGTTFPFELGDLHCIADLSNGVGNWWKGFSRIEALRKVITNSEKGLDAKNINLRFSGKFMVAGTTDPKDTLKRIMGDDEKKEIKERTNSDKQVTAVKTMAEIRRFVEDMKALEFDQAYLADYFIIGTAYNIPRDVLEAYKSSTFENQEKARAGHVSYTLEPAAEQLCDMLADAWGYTKKGWTICLSWDHLPFAQVFEKERSQIQQLKASTLNSLLKAGVDIESINLFLDTEFKLSANATAQQQNTELGSKAAAAKRKVYVPRGWTFQKAA